MFFFADPVPTATLTGMALTYDARFSEELKAICSRIDFAPQALIDWFASEELGTPAAVGVICTKEDDVPTAIITNLADHGTFRIKQRGAITRVWLLCRQDITRDEARAAGRVNQQHADEPISSEVTDPCYALWLKKYGVRILSAKLLVDTMLNSLNRELATRPRRLAVRLAETLRTANCISKQDSHALVIRPGQQATRSTEVNDEVTDKYNLFIRVRAWLYSIAFLTVADGTFLSAGKAEYYSELILDMMHQRFGGTPPPLSHFVTAYLQSAKVWVEAVRDGHTLESAIMQEATWKHHRTTYNTSSSPAASPTKPTSSNASPDVPDQLQSELTRLKTQNRDLQSQRDRALSQANKTQKGGGRSRAVVLSPRGKGGKRRREG